MAPKRHEFAAMGGPPAYPHGEPPLSSQVVDSPNFDDEVERAMRKRLILAQNQWLRQPPLPNDLAWWRGRISVSDLRGWLFVNDRTWQACTGGTRRVGDLADTLDTPGKLYQVGRDLR